MERRKNHDFEAIYKEDCCSGISHICDTCGNGIEAEQTNLDSGHGRTGASIHPMPHTAQGAEKEAIMKKHRKFFRKGSLAAMALAVAIVASIAVPAYAESNQEVATASSTLYISYSLTIYSGVRTYTTSGNNYTNTAALYTTSIDSKLSGISAGIYSTSSNSLVSGGTKSITGTGYTQFNPAHQFSGQSVHAGFYKANINGAYKISGRFYYDGL